MDSAKSCKRWAIQGRQVPQGEPSWVIVRSLVLYSQGGELRGLISTVFFVNCSQCVMNVGIGSARGVPRSGYKRLFILVEVIDVSVSSRTEYCIQLDFLSRPGFRSDRIDHAVEEVSEYHNTGDPLFLGRSPTCFTPNRSR